MAESSKDIESGSDGLKSPLLREEEASEEETSEREASQEEASEQKASLHEKVRYFAFRLALLEKAASTLGTVNFIWATAVLLGGFSESLKWTDFTFVSVILVEEGLRILGRRGELPTRWSRSSGNALIESIYLYSAAMQEYAPIACIVLSSLRIQKQQYGSDGNLNRNRARNIFYFVSLVESSLSLLGSFFRVTFSKSSFVDNEECSRSLIFRVVGKNGFSEYGLDKSDKYFDMVDMVRRFFDEAYSRCINGSVFDGLKMDFVSYSMELLLQSIDDNEQLTMGAQLLLALLKSDQLPSKKLRAIETKPGVLERLIELLNWEEPREQEIRTVAAQIISKLMEFPRNRIRVIAFPESMESIQSLLYDKNQTQVHSRKYQGQSSDKYNYRYLSDLGLWILKNLANDPVNCAKLKTNEVLLCQITELAELDSGLSESEIVMRLKSLPRPASLGRQQDDRQNINATSGFEAEHSDDPNLLSGDISQV